MKIYINKIFLQAVILMMAPLRAFALEEKMGVQQSVNTSPVLVADPMSGSYLVQLIMGLFIVLLCIIALAWITKKINRFRFIADDSLKIIGGLSMGSRERIVLLQVAEKQLLIGVAPGRINTLYVLDTPIQAVDSNSAQSSAQSFSNKLKTIMSAASKNQTSTNNND